NTTLPSQCRHFRLICLASGSPNLPSTVESARTACSLVAGNPQPLALTPALIRLRARHHRSNRIRLFLTVSNHPLFSAFLEPKARKGNLLEKAGPHSRPTGDSSSVKAAG